MNQESLLDVLRRKLEELQKAEAITADPSLKFQLKEQIKEVQSRIDEAIQDGEGVAGHAGGLRPRDRRLMGKSAGKLRSARDRVKQLTKEGADQAKIDGAKAEVLACRREIREGGRLKPGDVLLDRYELLECVGSGGFATVWRCYDEEAMCSVAAKILRPSHREERTKVERFYRGARLMKQLSHESIVRVLEAKCNDDGLHFYIMEFADGGDFREAVLGRKRSPESVFEIVLAAADALHHAHTVLPDMVHRDVKPANILLTAEGTVRVTDFDLVRMADTTGGTRTGGLGTFIYAAPESLQDASSVDVRADVFSLGMTTIFGLHGQELPQAAFWDAASFIESLDCSTSIKQVLKRAVEREAAERFASMEEFAAGLREALAIQKTASRKELPDENVRKNSKASPAGSTAKRKTSTKRSPLASDSGEIATNSIGMKLKLIPAGEFMMGTPATSAGSSYRENPQHLVRITKPFYLSIYAVTQEEYVRLMGKNPSRFTGDDRRPVETVSWNDAIEFCNVLSKQAELAPYYMIEGQDVSIVGGTGYRLPTEAEWEYACRAGTTTKWSTSDTAEGVESVAWYGKEWQNGTYPVGEKVPNPWGLYDMHGNVLEWCWDWYDEYASVDAVDPRGPNSGDRRVSRGGSFNLEANKCRSAFRDKVGPVERLANVGFRVSRALTDKSGSSRQARPSRLDRELERINYLPANH